MSSTRAVATTMKMASTPATAAFGQWGRRILMPPTSAYRQFTRSCATAPPGAHPPAPPGGRPWDPPGDAAAPPGPLGAGQAPQDGGEEGRQGRLGGSGSLCEGL